MLLPIALYLWGFYTHITNTIVTNPWISWRFYCSLFFFSRIIVGFQSTPQHYEELHITYLVLFCRWCVQHAFAREWLWQVSTTHGLTPSTDQPQLLWPQNPNLSYDMTSQTCCQLYEGKYCNQLNRLSRDFVDRLVMDKPLFLIL